MSFGHTLADQNYHKTNIPIRCTHCGALPYDGCANANGTYVAIHKDRLAAAWRSSEPMELKLTDEHLAVEYV